MDQRHPLLESFDNGLALISASDAGRVEACLTSLLAHEHGQAMLDDRAFNDDGFWDTTSWTAAYRPYSVVDGVLHIPVKGVLLHDFGFALGDWATGYVYIRRAFERGCADFKAGTIKGIALIHHTPGGMVAGCFDLVDRMHALKVESGVPVRGYAHEAAYSAGYATISVCDHITVSRTGGVGSVGVVTSHIDASGQMERFGLKRTWIFAGEHKVDGNSDGPLPADVKARMQERINETYDVFVSTVARNRPVLSEESVRATQALTFTATQALSNKFADSIGALDDALAAFAADLSPNQGDDEMADTASTTAVDQAAHEAAVTTARTEGHAAGFTEGRTEAVARINAIIGSDEAKDRPKAAMSAALKTGMSVDEAKAFLGDLPKETAEATTVAPVVEAATPFDAAMDRDNPNVGANGRTDANGESDPDDASDVLTLVRGAGLKGFAAPAA